MKLFICEVFLKILSGNKRATDRKAESTESMLLVFMWLVDNKKNMKHFQPNHLMFTHYLYLIFWQNSSQTQHYL